MKEGFVLIVFFIVALVGITALVYPTMSGSMTASPCAPTAPLAVAKPPVTPNQNIIPVKPPALPRTGRSTGDRSFYIDESGVIRVNPCPPLATPSDSPIGG